MARAEMAEEELVLRFVVVAAFDENGWEGTGGDFGCGITPYEVVPWMEGDGVGFDVAEDEDFG